MAKHKSKSARLPKAIRVLADDPLIIPHDPAHQEAPTLPENSWPIPKPLFILGVVLLMWGLWALFPDWLTTAENFLPHLLFHFMGQ